MLASRGRKHASSVVAGTQVLAEKLEREKAAAAARQEQRPPPRRASIGTGASADSPMDVTGGYMLLPY